MRDMPTESGLLIRSIERSAVRAFDREAKDLIGLSVHQNGVAVPATEVRRVIAGVEDGWGAEKGAAL
jgi:hypothetical protein